MHRSLYLCLVFLLIYTCFLYIQNKSFLEKMFSIYQIKYRYIQEVLIAIECFTILLGGIVAAFVIAPAILFSISLICLVVGVSISVIYVYLVPPWNTHTYVNRITIYYLGLLLFGIFYGLFRFIILVMMLNQGDSRSIRRKCIEWFIVLNICYMIVWIFLPTPEIENYSLILCLAMAFMGVGLLILGHRRKYYTIYTEPINIKNSIDIFKKLVPNLSTAIDEDRQDILESLNITASQRKESKKVLSALSKSIMIFILCIPYGICDSQARYAYMYQSNQMRKPKLNSYFHGRSNMWPIFFSSLTVICFLLILLCLRKLRPTIYYKIYPKNIKHRIIFGNILMVVSTLMNGVLETLEKHFPWGFNTTALIPILKFDHQNFKTAGLSVFYMVPQIVILGISEVYFLLSILELMVIVSTKNIKYLSISFVLAAIGNGGLSDSFFIIIDNVNISKNRHLDEILYGLTAVAFISLVISAILIKTFSKVFVNNQSEAEDLEQENIN